MKITITVIASILIQAAVVFAALDWESKTLDLKAKLGDSKISGIFKFTNTGTELVEIKQVKTSCGCTTATLAKKTYAPGESGEIKATLNVGNRVGPQRKSITVTTANASERYTLILKATIPEVIKYQPRVLIWAKDGEKTPRTVEIDVAIDEMVELTVRAAANIYTTKLVTLEKGKKFQLIVTPKSTADINNTVVSLQAKYPSSSTPKHFKVFVYVK